MHTLAMLYGIKYWLLNNNIFKKQVQSNKNVKIDKQNTQENIGFEMKTVGMLGPGVLYLIVSWAYGPSWRWAVVRGG